MPLNPENEPTRKERAVAASTSVSAYLHRHAPVIAAFLGGVLVGLLVP